MKKNNMCEVYEKIKKLCNNEIKLCEKNGEFCESEFFKKNVYNVLKNSNYVKYIIEGGVDIEEDEGVKNVEIEYEDIFKNEDEKRYFIEIIKYIGEVEENEYGYWLVDIFNRVILKIKYEWRK